MSDQEPSQTSGHEQTPQEKSQKERSGNVHSAGSGGGGRQGGGRRRHRQPSPQQNQARRPDASLNMEELRELMEMFTAHGLTDFEIENEDIRVRLSRNLAPLQSTATTIGVPTSQISSASSTAEASNAEGASTPASSGRAGGAATTGTMSTEDLHIITSPIVGTFYRAPSPTADSFVRPGSHVEPDTIVCIIEAMKLMNEIQAETTGVVEKIYVENGQPVEYGQPLFGIKK